MSDIFELPDKKNDKVENVEQAFEEIIGRTVNEEEKARLHKVKDVLKINSSDTLWLLLLQMERYQSLYDEVPGKISGTVECCINKIKSATDKEIKRVEIDIERMIFKANQAYANSEYELLHKINEATERIYLTQQESLMDASAREHKLKIWSIVGIVALIQMSIIILTNSVTAIIASGNSKLPWIILKEGATRSDWFFQLVWNFPSGWVISFMVFLGGGHFIYDKFIRNHKHIL